MAEKRDAKGRFIKGNAPKSPGRPKIPDDIKETFKKITPKAVERLEEIINNPKTDYKTLIQAINTVLDRAYGKAPQHIEQNNSGEIRIILEGSMADYGD